MPIYEELLDSVWKDKPKRTIKKIIDLEKLYLMDNIIFRKNKKISKIYDSLYKECYKPENSLNADLIPGISHEEKIKKNPRKLRRK